MGRYFQFPTSGLCTLGRLLLLGELGYLLYDSEFKLNLPKRHRNFLRRLGQRCHSRVTEDLGELDHGLSPLSLEHAQVLLIRSQVCVITPKEATGKAVPLAATNLRSEFFGLKILNKPLSDKY